MKIYPGLPRFGGSLLALATAILLASPVPARAAEEVTHPEKPMLWKVEGGGLEKPSYLFGTIHLGDPVVTTLHPAAQKAFDEATAFYAEVPLDAAGQVAAMPVILRKDGKSLTESIGGERAAELDQELKRINPALDAKPFQTMKTFYIAAALPLLKEQLAGKKPLDLILWEKAHAAGKKTAGIETIQAQMAGFNALTEPEQVEMLAATLKAMKTAREEGKTTLHGNLRDAYLSGDPLRLRAQIKEELSADWGSKEVQEKLEKSLLRDRDVTMANFIAEALRKEPSATQFFAVGAAHYCGEVSILSHLAKAGFTVTRIEP